MATCNPAPAWRRAFLRELARSGSVALAAEVCAIDRSSAYQLRRRNAAFAASWERALEAAREKLSPRPSTPPAASLRINCREAAGGDLRPLAQPPEAPASRSAGARVRLRSNETIRASRSGKPCVAKVGPGRWSAATERAFLAELSASANVAAAARAVGLSSTSAYNRRRLRPDFMARWDAAKEIGHDRVELFLIHAASVALDPEPLPEAAREAPAMTIDQALAFHKLHRPGQHGGKPQRYAWRQQEPDIEEVRAEILRKVAAMERVKRRRIDVVDTE